MKTKDAGVQALTAIVYVACGVAAMYLYLHASFRSAFALTMAVTQGWRVLSETLRADYRGNGRISAYQVMGLAGIVYCCAVICFIQPPSAPPPGIAAGLAGLWTPSALLFLQALWLGIFLHTGRSSVTGATVSFHVHHDRI